MYYNKKKVHQELTQSVLFGLADLVGPGTLPISQLTDLSAVQIECPPHLWQTARPSALPQPWFVLGRLSLFFSLSRSLSPHRFRGAKS